MKLNPEWVEHLMKECLFSDVEVDSMPPDELAVKAVKVRGLVHNVGFNPDRLKANESLIIELLKELPAEFHANHGGGMSFLRAPCNKEGEQWGDQQDAEKLMMLGIGIGKMEYMLPREVWSVLPGGVPYLVVKGVVE